MQKNLNKHGKIMEILIDTNQGLGIVALVLKKGGTLKEAIEKRHLTR